MYTLRTFQLWSRILILRFYTVIFLYSIFRAKTWGLRNIFYSTDIRLHTTHYTHLGEVSSRWWKNNRKNCIIADQSNSGCIELHITFEAGEREFLSKQNHHENNYFRVLRCTTTTRLLAFTSARVFFPLLHTIVDNFDRFPILYHVSCTIENSPEDLHES